MEERDLIIKKEDIRTMKKDIVRLKKAGEQESPAVSVFKEPKKIKKEKKESFFQFSKPISGERVDYSEVISSDIKPSSKEKKEKPLPLTASPLPQDEPRLKPQLQPQPRSQPQPQPILKPKIQPQPQTQPISQSLPQPLVSSLSSEADLKNKKDLEEIEKRAEAKEEIEKEIEKIGKEEKTISVPAPIPLLPVSIGEKKINEKEKIISENKKFAEIQSLVMLGDKLYKEMNI